MTDAKGKLVDDAYTWAEDRPGGGGGGPRSMKIMGPGIERGGHLFSISPNPHANAAYNDGGQQKLYDGFAKQINAGWPKMGSSSYKAVTDPSDLPKNIKDKALKMDKTKQKQAIDNYNKEQKATVDAKVLETYRSSVVKHILGKKGSAFTFGGETYKLG